MADASFDLFLKHHGLERNRELLLQHEYDTIDLVLELTEAEMKAIGMVGGAIRKVQRAQRQSRDNRDSLFLPSAKGLSTQEKQCGSTAAEVVVFEPEYYEPATVIHDWRCQLDSSEHDIFVSYRSSSESDSANMLVASLVSGKRKDLSIHPFLDHLCLHDSQDWECGFINALHNSPVIVLLLSERGLERVRQAHTTPDNLLLEIQHALKLAKDSVLLNISVVIQPIFMWSNKTIDNKKYSCKYLPDPEHFPNFPPAHKKSPLFDDRPMTVRQTIREILKLQALDAVDGNALKRLVPNLRELCAKTTKFKEIATRQFESIVLSAHEDCDLVALLDPIDFDQDRRALEDLFMKGTRQWLLTDITSWVNADNDDPVLWVNAVAGTGKSVSAAQIASLLTASSQLVASIFLKYNDTRKSNPRMVLTTIAYGLCRWYAPIGRRLLATVARSDGERTITKDDLDKMSIPELFKTVIADPLEAIGDYRPKGSVMILVDALDECSPRDQLLSLLAGRFVELNKTRPWLKLLLTSRPEADIKAAFDGVPTKTIEPSSGNNVDDLSIYIGSRLKKYNLPKAERDSIVSSIIFNSAHESHGLEDHGARGDQSKTFVWINLILNTLSDIARDGPVTLAAIKDINDSVANVDQLYQKTFDKIYSQASHPAELVTVISAMATAQSVLTPRIISGIFKIDLRVVQDGLARLALVLDPGVNGSTADSHVEFNHKSVADYLLDYSFGEPFHVSSQFHLVFAKGCLDVILAHDPVINICDIYDLHTEIPDFDDRVSDKIAPSLRYSVAHWITHFVWRLDTAPTLALTIHQLWSTGATSLLSKLLSTHVFFWLECASLMNVIKPVIEQLAVLRRVVTNDDRNFGQVAKALVVDVYRFIREFADPVIKSAPQVYNSGFVFTPKETLLYKTYAPQIEDRVPFRVAAGPPSSWDPCVATLSGHTAEVIAAAISPDTKMVVAGSRDGAIRVWDAVSAQSKFSIEGHAYPVNAVAVSPDGNMIVSGSGDRTIKIWDVVMGHLIDVIEGHTDAVSSVAISPDGKSLVSGSYDTTVRIWNLETLELEARLVGHTDSVLAVAYSSDGKQILSSSGDATVNIWDAVTRRWKIVLVGHRDSVSSVTISPDSKWIVSGSYDKTVRVWDAETGQARLMLEGHTSWVTQVAIVPHGQSIVSGSSDHSIKVWDLATGQLRTTLKGHSSHVNSIAVSPYERWIVSVSDDKTLKVWDPDTSGVEQSADGHTGPVTTAAVCQTGTVMVSGSYDQSLKLWDTGTGRLLQTLKQHSQCVRSVSISADGESIESLDYDGNQILWSNTEDGFVPFSQHRQNRDWTDTPLPPSTWSQVVDEAQWIRHGPHMIKVPHAFFNWDGQNSFQGDRHRCTASESIIFWGIAAPYFPLVIHPSYRNSTEAGQDVPTSPDQSLQQDSPGSSSHASTSYGPQTSTPPPLQKTPSKLSLRFPKLFRSGR